MTVLESKAMDSICQISRTLRESTRINWESRRYESAKAILASICLNYDAEEDEKELDAAVKFAVTMADKLMAKLKETNQ